MAFTPEQVPGNPWWHTKDQEVQVKRGPNPGLRYVSRADVTNNNEFWEAYRANSKRFKDMGISVRRYRGKWEATLWREPHEVESTRRSSSPDSGSRTVTDGNLTITHRSSTSSRPDPVVSATEIHAPIDPAKVEGQDKYDRYYARLDAALDEQLETRDLELYDSRRLAAEMERQGNSAIEIAVRVGAEKTKVDATKASANDPHAIGYSVMDPSDDPVERYMKRMDNAEDELHETGSRELYKVRKRNAAS